ncbi:MAG: ATP-binding protein [Candidatus Accumulibacter sp.]|uniref:AlbA family DNA-binding domain-containing protein n=1 Tax=Accumulibacter sp. TaxID=2053492 RepID=UPI0025835F7D|nr:ATP-binding protein [Accumulibacter sp.]MCM8620316.1 ATP-binding protein [Accumulibacter sp.]
MITALTIDEILQFLAKTPEQAVFDWKQDFVHPADDDARGELIKDIAAIANASVLSYGFIFYGVDPRRPDPLVGITRPYDDARLQQLVQGKLEPIPSFLYYEVSAGPKTVGVIQVAPSKKRPYIIRVDIGRIRKGQIVIRRGSSTDGVTLDDLAEFFYGQYSQYFANVRQRLGLDVQRQQAITEYIAELRRGAEAAEDHMWQAAGFLGGKPRR